MRKRYDRSYFDNWYRGAGQAVGSVAALRRNVALAVAVAESVLARPLRSVLDVGCGEGRWQPALHRLRPNASYLGIDSSEYAVERFGKRRNLRLGSFEELEFHVFERPFDLVVCSDVLHYLTPKQIRRGLPVLADLTGGAALLEVFTAADDIEGDDLEFFRRTPAWYRREIQKAGFTAIGLQMYVPTEIVEDLDAMDFAF
jgi:SAM-dependent methyltransferase